MLQQKSVDFIRIDINSGQVRKAISICQSDPTMRTLAMTIVDSGVPVVSDELLYAEILIKKADGEHEATNGCVIDGDAIEYTLRSTDISALGENKAQIMLTYKDGAVITTPPFIISVYDKVLNPNVQKSLNEYTSITQQLLLATTAAEDALKSQNVATSAVETCNNTLDEINTQVIQVQNSEFNAKVSEENAKVSEENSAASAVSASSSADRSQAMAASVSEALGEALDYAERILSVEVDVKEDASRAEKSADRAEAALGELGDAVERAASEADRARDNADEANSYVTQASGYAINASDYSTLSKSYAMGDTGVRELEDTENARYFYEQSKAIYERLGSALTPKGTIAFESLPAFDDVDEGWMYNILNDFTTDSRFVDGAGKNYSAGNNIYCIVDDGTKKWDVLSSPAIVRKATTSELGIVKPDGSTITIDEDGTIHGTPLEQILSLDSRKNTFLESGTDLDEIVGIGNYGSHSSKSQSMLNCPTKAVAFVMSVERIYGSDNNQTIKQTLRDSNNNEWHRTRLLGVWSDWDGETKINTDLSVINNSLKGKSDGFTLMGNPYVKYYNDETKDYLQIWFDGSNFYAAAAKGGADAVIKKLGEPQYVSHTPVGTVSYIQMGNDVYNRGGAKITLGTPYISGNTIVIPETIEYGGYWVAVGSAGPTVTRNIVITFK